MSTVSDRRVAYRKALMKKLLFQIHPDFFHNFKQQQAINTTNLTVLEDLVQGGIPDSGTKSLIFFVKPMDGELPRRVKVSVRQMERSVVEILQTIGVALPPGAEGFTDDAFATGGGAAVLASPQQILDYLEGMHERRELVAWREDRTRALRLHEQRLLAETGALAVTYRNSLSAQNNSVVLARLLSLVLEHRVRLRLPWTGMKIVVSPTNSEQTVPIDYLEREILLDPSHVPIQWLQLLQDVDLAALRAVEGQVRKLSNMKGAVETFAAVQLGRAVKRERGMAPVRVLASVRRGFTCSQNNFCYFLQRVSDELGADVGVGSGGATAEIWGLPSLSLSDADYNYDDVEGFHGSSSSSDVQQDHKQGPGHVELRPVEVELVVEESHGTKLLPDGTFRVDVRTSASALRKLLVAGAEQCALHSQQHQHLLQEQATLHARLLQDLRILELRPGVGVDCQMFTHFLRSADAYARLGRRSRGALRQLEGMRVIIGYYLGTSDDGACLLPWDMELLPD